MVVSSNARMIVRLGIFPDSRTRYPNIPNPIPNYPNLKIPIAFSGARFKIPNFIWEIRDDTHDTRISRIPEIIVMAQ